MGNAYKPIPVKLTTGLIFKEHPVYKKTITVLQKHFGKIDFESPHIPFTYTAYYEKEFGRDLKRAFVSFKRLVPPEKLYQIKTITNAIEKKTSSSGLRKINIDPGLLDMAKIVLATTKDFCHRIYLNKGIYAEVTLFYQNNSFRHWEWTYPDYRTKEYIGIFNKIREIYAQQMKSLKQ